MSNIRPQSSEPVLVTGGGGYIGSHVVRHLVDLGRAVRVLDLPDVDLAHLPRDAQLIRGDIRNPVDVRLATTGCATVLHLAADPNLWSPDPRHFEQVNHQGTHHVLDAAAASGVQRVVHVSTESILTCDRCAGPIDESVNLDPHSAVGPYCRSKMLAEQAAWDGVRDGLPVVIVNPTVPIGPGDHRGGPLTRMIRHYLAGRIRHFYLDGQINLIDVRDIALGVCAAAERGEVGQRYLLSNETWSIRRLFRTLADLTGRPAPRCRAPYWPALAFAAVEQWWCRYVSGNVPMATTTGIRLTRRSFDFDGSVSMAALGINPRPVAPALKATVTHLRQFVGMANANEPSTATGNSGVLP